MKFILTYCCSCGVWTVLKHFLSNYFKLKISFQAFDINLKWHSNNQSSLSCVESAKKSPSEWELKIIELSSCSLDLLST